MSQPKKPATPSSPLPGSVISASGLGGGQVLSFGPPKAGDIEEMVRTAKLRWQWDFGYLEFTQSLEGQVDVIEMASWIEELHDVEVVQFFVGVAMPFEMVLVRKKRI